MAKTHLAPPDLQTQAGRLRFARERAKFSSPRAAAAAFGWNENTYKSHELGIRGAEGIKPRHLRKYARALGVSYPWLATGAGGPTITPEDEAWQGLSEAERAKALELLKVASTS